MLGISCQSCTAATQAENDRQSKRKRKSRIEEFMVMTETKAALRLSQSLHYCLTTIIRDNGDQRAR